MAGLKTYRAKRDFGQTAEPRGRSGRAKTGKPKAGKQKRGGATGRYVIQKHAATRLHYDLRLELDGVMMSWAVTRGPSLIPGDKRLAIHVEDHPIEYNKFEGTIPKGQYGGGTVMIWDRGTWQPDHDPHKGMKKGHLDFSLDGDKLKGHWHLVRMRQRPGERQEPWLLIKATDEFARAKKDRDILDEMPDSATSGRTMDEIAADKKKVWQSKPRAQGSRSAALKAKFSTRTGKARVRAPQKKASDKKQDSAKKRSKERAKDRDIARIAGARKASLPDFVPPCLATLSAQAPASGDWLHEIKFDGYRILARIEDGVVRLKTRNGLDWTERFPTVAEACAALGSHAAMLDGEIVVQNESGVSDFSSLQDDLKSGRHDRMIYYVFDLLHFDGFDLTPAMLIDRKAALAQLLTELPKDGLVRLSEHFDTDGPRLLRHACDMNLEGVMSKRSDARYHSGRSGDWLKTKCASNQELVIAGYEPSDKNGRAIRSLLLAYYDKDGLRYAGRVGTGWGEAKERDLIRKLSALTTSKPPFDPVPEVERRRNVKWVKPELVAEIDFRGWTGGTLLRQASFKGLREDKPAKQVVRELRQMPQQTKRAALRQKPMTKSKPAATKPAATAVSVAGVTLTHPDRVYWDDAGVTKQDLAQYYEQVWDVMRPHVTERVLALVRCPEGATGQCFFQKHASAGVEAKRLHLVPEPGGDKSIAIDDLPGLISLVQGGALEIHVRGSSIDDLEAANRLVFDLDPGAGIGWPDLIKAAREVRERLHDLKLESFVKTTGGKGLHVVLPIRATPWDEAKDFCRRIAEAMAADDRARYTATVKKTARNNRIFVDYLRNSREATAVAPYSSRARPGATVSVPVTWEELGGLKAPNHFTVENLPKRLAKLRKYPWTEIGRIKQRLPAGR